MWNMPSNYNLDQFILSTTESKSFLIHENFKDLELWIRGVHTSFWPDKITHNPAKATGLGLLSLELLTSTRTLKF